MSTPNQRINQFFRQMQESGSSDLHLAAGRAPAIRTHGEVVPIGEEPVLDDGELRAMLRTLVSASRWNAFVGVHDLDFAYRLEGVGRFRANYFFQEHGVGAVFRHIPEQVIPLEKLNMPQSVAGLADLEAGLVLVTGPTGSGKSTTLAAIIDRINTKHCRHIVTIEDPVEFVHPNKRSVVSQREVGTNTVSFAAALKSATREDADVALVGELRDLETIELALTAASMGILVFGTLHTNSAAKTIDRIIDVYPAELQAQARNSVADALAGVVSQVLLRTKDGAGRVAANEILLRTSAMGGVIREGNTAMLNSLIASGKRAGMQSLDGALFELVEKERVDPREAYLYALDKQRFSQFL